MSLRKLNGSFAETYFNASFPNPFSKRPPGAFRLQLFGRATDHYFWGPESYINIVVETRDLPRFMEAKQNCGNWNENPMETLLRLEAEGVIVVDVLTHDEFIEKADQMNSTGIGENRRPLAKIEDVVDTAKMALIVDHAKATSGVLTNVLKRLDQVMPVLRVGGGYDVINHRPVNRFIF